jgi:transaldolase
VNTLPEATLLAFADHGTLGGHLAADGGGSGRILADIAAAGIDLTTLGDDLQQQGAAAFVKSWDELLEVIAGKAKNAAAR